MASRSDKKRECKEALRATSARAQAAGLARCDVEGTDHFALVGALAWIHDQPSLAPRADYLFQFAEAASRHKEVGTARSTAASGGSCREICR